MECGIVVFVRETMSIACQAIAAVGGCPKKKRQVIHMRCTFMVEVACRMLKIEPLNNYLRAHSRGMVKHVLSLKFFLTWEILTSRI